MSNPQATIRIAVDPANPGQFFACCGLLELADRVWAGAEGWFTNGWFNIAGGGARVDVLDSAKTPRLQNASEDDKEEDEDEDTFVPLVLVAPVQLRLDWWQDK